MLALCPKLKEFADVTCPILEDGRLPIDDAPKVEPPVAAAPDDAPAIPTPALAAV